MHIAFILASVCVACVVLGIYATRSTRHEKRAGAIKGISLAPTTSIPQSAIKRRLCRINAKELSQLIRTDPELTIFHLHDGSFSHIQSKRLRGELAVTLRELEETLPWIPRGSRIAIYHPGGVDPSLNRRLSAIMHGRQAFLLSGPLPSAAETFDQIADEICK